MYVCHQDPTQIIFDHSHAGFVVETPAVCEDTYLIAWKSFIFLMYVIEPMLEKSKGIYHNKLACPG